jgi:hypothetical protein
MWRKLLGGITALLQKCVGDTKQGLPVRKNDNADYLTGIHLGKTYLKTHQSRLFL